MLLEMFVLGTMWFWVLAAIFVVTLLIGLEKENGSFLTIATIVFFVAWYMFGDFGNVLTYIVQNPFSILFAIGVYLAAGAVWGVTKWWFFVNGMAREIQSAKRKFFEVQHNLPYTADAVIPEALKAQWKRFLDHEVKINLKSLPPKVSENKSRITTWMIYWPVSAIWTLVNDPVVRAFHAIYERLGGLMQNISNSAFNKVRSDLPD